MKQFTCLSKSDPLDQSYIDSYAFYIAKIWLQILDICQKRLYIAINKNPFAYVKINLLI